MSEHISLTATKRDRAGKGNARATRREGRVPAVIYGDNQPPITISLDFNTLLKAYNSTQLFTHVCDLDVEGTNHVVLARDVQMHPVKDVPLHVDFLRVSDKTFVTVDVPVQFHNQDKAPGIRKGGVLNISMHTIEVTCRADAIPEKLVVDLSVMKLDMGQDVKMSQIKLPMGVKTTVGADETVATIVAASTVEEAAA